MATGRYYPFHVSRLVLRGENGYLVKTELDTEKKLMFTVPTRQSSPIIQLLLKI